MPHDTPERLSAGRSPKPIFYLKYEMGLISKRNFGCVLFCNRARVEAKP
jgi:hypothetical protein